MRIILNIVLSLLFVFAFTGTVTAGGPSGYIDSEISKVDDRLVDQEDIFTLEQRLGELESNESLPFTEKGYAPIGMVTFLFGAFCALWAQNTGRSAVGWFFLGLFFNMLTVIALLIRNSQDIDERRSGKPATN